MNEYAGYSMYSSLNVFKQFNKKKRHAHNRNKTQRPSSTIPPLLNTVTTILMYVSLSSTNVQQMCGPFLPVWILLIAAASDNPSQSAKSVPTNQINQSKTYQPISQPMRQGSQVDPVPLQKTAPSIVSLKTVSSSAAAAA